MPVQVIVVIERDTHAGGRTAWLPEFEFSWQVQRGEIVVGITSRRRHCKIVRALRSRNVNTINFEIVALGLAAEDRVIVENQCPTGRVQTMKVVRRRQSREAAADNHEIKYLTRFRYADRRCIEAPCTDIVRGANQLRRVTVRLRIVTESAGAIPVSSDSEAIVLTGGGSRIA